MYDLVTMNSYYDRTHMLSNLDTILHDPQRLAVLQQLSLLDTPIEPAFDRLTQLASKILGTPVSLVSLVDGNRQFFKSSVGLAEPWATLRGTPLSHSFCQHTVASGEPLIIDDARQHPLVRDNLAIPDLGVIAYAGIPLITPSGKAIGSFCVIDTQPRHWQAEDISILKDLAASVMTEIALRAELIDRTRVQEVLRETEDRYRALFDRSLDAVFIHDFEGNFIDANDAALRLMGYTRSEITSLNFASLLMTPDQLLIAFEIIEEIKAKGFQESVREFRLKTKAGGEMTVEILSSLIDHKGQPWAIQGIARDVSPHKQAEEVLRTAYEREKHLGDLRSRFMSMVSHDFRTPLTIIQSSSDILKQYGDRLTDERKGKHLETIQRQVKRQLELLDDLLTMSKSESVNIDFNPTWVNWELFCRDLIDELQITAATTHQLAFSSNGKHPDAQIDKKLIHRAISNLISNTIKYSPDGGTIWLNLVCDEDKTVLLIQDSGIGISVEDQLHLFEPFYRAKNSKSLPGTGLGLVIVKQAVEAHRGTIKVDSQINVGTTFTITIPRLEQANFS